MFPKRVGIEGLVRGVQYYTGGGIRVQVDFVADDLDMYGDHEVYLISVERPGKSLPHTVKPDETFELLEPKPLNIKPTGSNGILQPS